MSKPSDQPHAVYGPQLTWAGWVLRRADATVVKRFDSEEAAMEWLKHHDFTATGTVENEFV